MTAPRRSTPTSATRSAVADRAATADSASAVAELVEDADATPTAGITRPSPRAVRRTGPRTRGVRPQPTTKTVRPPTALGLLTFVYLLWTLLPLAVMVRLSLNAGTDVGAFTGPSAQWLTGDAGVLGGGARFGDAIGASLRLAAFTTVIAVPLGMMYAVGMVAPPLRSRPRLAAVVGSLPLVGAVVPSILVGLVLVVGSRTVFDALFGLGSRGGALQLVGHVTIATALVALIARCQLTEGTAALVDVARDLGASRWRATLFAVGPTVLPSVLVGGLVAFTTSLDDLAVSHLVTIAGVPGSDRTAPVEVYDSTLQGPTPAAFATATVLLGIVVAGIVFVVAALAALRRREDVATTATFGGVRTGLGR